MPIETAKILAEANALVADDVADPVERLKACEFLVQHGIVEPVLPVLRTLVTDPALVRGARLLLHTAQYMKRRGLVNELTSLPADEGTSRKPALGDAAFWRSRDPKRAAQNLLMVFTGAEKNFWISLDLLHRIIRNIVGQAAYLRDFANVFFLAGIDPYRDYPSTVDGLKTVITRCRAEKLYVMGISAGGFAALKYGLDLEADAVLAFGPPTEISRYLTNIRQMAKRFRDYQIGDEMIDVVPFYERAARRPDVTIVFGGANKRDQAQGQRLAHLPGVRLVPIPGLAMHGSVAHLLGTGRFEGLVQELVRR